MKTYGNDFVYGRERAKKYAIAAAAFCVFALLCGFFYPTIQIYFAIVSTVLMIMLIVTIVKYCRCPHCHKVIFFGVLQETVCPRCKRSLVTGKKVKKK